MAEILYEGEINGIIRENIIKEFLNLTQFFTLWAFNEIITDQIGLISNFDEQLVKKVTDALEKKEKIVNFENLNNNGLVYIDEKGKILQY